MIFCQSESVGFPLGENLENLENWEGSSQGKVREFWTGKVEKSGKINLENSDILVISK